MQNIDFRYIEYSNNLYIRLDDVINMLYCLADGFETDDANQLREMALNLRNDLRN